MKWILALMLCVPAFGQDFASVAVVGNLFHPREIAGINVHWDASTLQGANGTTVSNWVDTVSGISASNVVVSTCPQLVYTNGAKALRFDGVDDYLNAGTNTLNLITNTFSFFGVGSFSQTSPGFQLMFAKAILGPDANRYGFANEFNNTTYLFSTADGSSGAIGAGATISGLFSFDAYFNRGQGQGFRTNGLSAAHFVGGGFQPALGIVNNWRFLIGAFNGSSDVGQVSPLNGLICEIISVKRNGSNWVSSIESRKINEYFQNKYKLQRISRR